MQELGRAGDFKFVSSCFSPGPARWCGSFHIESFLCVSILSYQLLLKMGTLGAMDSFLIPWTHKSKGISSLLRVQFQAYLW